MAEFRGGSCSNGLTLCDLTMDCVNRNLTRLANGQPNSFVNFCEATNKCVNTQLYNFSIGLPTLLTYFPASVEKYLKSLPGYADVGQIALTSVDSVLEWASGSGGAVTSVQSGNGMNFTTITTSGVVTLGTPSSITLSSTNSVSATSHTHAFTPGGTISQYIRGDGSLAAFPAAFALTNGIGTTANGTAVDLGGLFSGNTVNVGTDSRAAIAFSPSSSYVRIGDAFSHGNNMWLTIYDAAKAMIFSMGTNQYLSIDANGGTMGMGDLSGAGNLTTIRASDITSQVYLQASGELIYQNPAGKKFLKLSNTSKVYEFGDLDASTNGSLIKIDDNTKKLYYVEGSLAAASNGMVWVLVDNTTGEGAWSAIDGGGP